MNPPPRRWIVAVVVAWSVVLAGLAGWGIAHTSFTDREETTVAQALPRVNRALTDIASASTVDGLAVVTVGELTKVGACKVSVFRPGVRYERVLTVLVQPGTEDALLRRVAARLPASYATAVTGGGPARLTADAGLFVGVGGSSAAPGVVRFVVDTGDCRPAGNVSTSSTVATPGESAAVTDVLRRLGAAAGPVNRFAVPCPAGGELATVEAFAAGGPFDASRAAPGSGRPVVAAEDLYAYTVDRTEFAIRTVKGGVDVTATVLCGAQ